MKNGQLKVWWIPQVPMKALTVLVDNLGQAKMLLDTLAEYDLFQFRNNVKPDYSNAGGLQIWDETLDAGEDNEKWTDWFIDGYYDNLDEYIEDNPEKVFGKDCDDIMLNQGNERFMSVEDLNRFRTKKNKED